MPGSLRSPAVRVGHGARPRTSPRAARAVAHRSGQWRRAGSPDNRPRSAPAATLDDVIYTVEPDPKHGDPDRFRRRTTPCRFGWTRAGCSHEGAGSIWVARRRGLSIWRTRSKLALPGGGRSRLASPSQRSLRERQALGDDVDFAPRDRPGNEPGDGDDAVAEGTEPARACRRADAGQFGIGRRRGPVTIWAFSHASQ